MSFAEFTLWISPHSGVKEGHELFNILADASSRNARGAPVKFMEGRFVFLSFPLSIVCLCVCVCVCVCVSCVVYLCFFLCLCVCLILTPHSLVRYFCKVQCTIKPCVCVCVCVCVCMICVCMICVCIYISGTSAIRLSVASDGSMHSTWARKEPAARQLDSVMSASPCPECVRGGRGRKGLFKARAE
jgi:hypothetical protein